MFLLLVFGFLGLGFEWWIFESFGIGGLGFVMDMGLFVVEGRIVGVLWIL